MDGQINNVSTGKEPWLKSSILKMYLIHTFSSSSTRMWSFGVGIYLVILHPDSLTLAAIYGFFSGISTIIVGPIIGKWIDKTRRLRAAKIAFIVQHASMVICIGLFVVLMQFKDTISSIWNGSFQYFIISLIGLIANLASDASRIALQKDWIVVLSKGDEFRLARMNATLGIIDLTTLVITPILVGAIISYGSEDVGAAFIGGWNIMSVILEYICLVAIYNATPELARKQHPVSSNKTSVQVSTSAHPTTKSNDDNATKSFVQSGSGSSQDLPQIEDQTAPSCFSKVYKKLRTWFEESRIGWIDYFKYPARNAGLGYAALEMTVLGFDSITTGILLSQGVSESMLGIITSIGAGFGIIGNVCFPFLRNRVGKLGTGNIGFGVETLCLVLCVASTFRTPGSPFTYQQVDENPIINDCLGNATRNTDEDGNYSATVSELWNCNISVILLLAGIVSSRFGLWVADLSVTQIFQDVPESQRGVLSGVQGALDQSVYLLKYIIVLILPNPSTFGYLIALSWLFIFLGWVFFMVYSYQSSRKSNHQSVE